MGEVFTSIMDALFGLISEENGFILLAAGIGFMGAVIGGKIAGKSTLQAMDKQIREQRRRDEAEAERQAKNIVRVCLAQVTLKILELESVFRADLCSIDVRCDSEKIASIRDFVDRYNAKPKELYTIGDELRFASDTALLNMTAMNRVYYIICDTMPDLVVPLGMMYRDCDSVSDEYMVKMQNDRLYDILSKFNVIAVCANDIIDYLRNMGDDYDIDVEESLLAPNLTRFIRTYAAQYEQFKKQWQEGVKAEQNTDTADSSINEYFLGKSHRPT